MTAWLMALIVVAAIALALREAWVVIALPAGAEIALARGDLKRRQMLLERLASTRSLFGGRARSSARFRLAWMYMDKGLYEEAASQCRAMLESRTTPTVEANIRRRLADCLEGGGDVDAAGEERRLADACLAGAAPDPDTFVLEGKILSEAGRHAESVVAYENALARLPPEQDAARAGVMLKLALAAFRAGQMEKSVEWAEESLRHPLSPSLRHNAHSIAALGYSAQGNLEQAENHVRQALEWAKRHGNEDAVARYTARLGNLQRQRGDLVGAMETCQRASAMSLRDRRHIRLIEAECLRLWGRYDEARTALAQARRAKGHPAPHAERNSLAILALGQSWVEADDHKLQEARAFLTEASAELARDEKLSLWCGATDAWLLALAGDRDAALEKIDAASATAAASALDRRTKGACATLLGRALFECGEYDRCRAKWQESLALMPDPVQYPTAYYFIGECCWQLGDKIAARAAFIEAVAPGIDTLRTRQAQARLDEMDADRPLG